MMQITVRFFYGEILEHPAVSTTEFKSWTKAWAEVRDIIWKKADIPNNFSESVEDLKALKNIVIDKDLKMITIYSDQQAEDLMLI